MKLDMTVTPVIITLESPGEIISMFKIMDDIHDFGANNRDEYQMAKYIRNLLEPIVDIDAQLEGWK